MERDVGNKEQEKGRQIEGVEEQEVERQGQKRDKNKEMDRVGKRNKMVKHESSLRYIEEIKNYEEVIRKKNSNKEGKKFGVAHRGALILEAVLNPNLRTGDKNVNMVKITQHIKRLECSIEKVKSSGFKRAEITFIDGKNANKCIERCNKDMKQSAQVYILTRAQRIKGIIKDWDLDMPLHELAEAIEENKDIIQLERMKKKKYNIQEKKMELMNSHLILIIFEDNILPKNFPCMER